MQPLFSVLIANYNNGKYLETCLQSILAQTYGNWEIVIVDDASTDDSHSVYERYRAHDRIRVFRNDGNKGCGYSKRKCVEYARGEICGFVDADDALTPDALEIMVRGHQDNLGTSIVYSTHYICDENLQSQKIADYVGQIPNGSRSMTLLRPTISHFATFKREKYEMTEGISEIFPKAVDKDLYYKLEETGPVLFVDKPLYLYRHHAGSISLNQHALTAHHYELTAKVLSSLREGRSVDIAGYLPHSEHQLIGSLLGVAYYEMKKMHIFISFDLLGKLSYFSSLSVLRFFLEGGIRRWRTRSRSSR